MRASLPIVLVIAAVALSCSPEPEAPTPVVDTDAPVELELPDISELDMPLAYQDALVLALTVNAHTAFMSHTRTLDRFNTGCPDIYAGPPPSELFDADVDEDAPGVTWADFCAGPDGSTFSGYGYWAGDVGVEGQPGSVEGLTVNADREMIADGVVGGPEGTVLEIDAELSDALYRVDADGYTRWSYSSLVDGTVTGSDPFPPGSLAPDGWRTDLYLYQSGGDIDRIEARGNVYLFEGRMQGRFDSMAMDLEVVGTLGAGPSDCTLEPRGWIGLRDEDAFWYDLVFLPRDDSDITGPDYPNDPLSDCDGCGTLYLRGVESGEVCPDFSFLFDGTREPPSVDEFILSLRDLP